jgi:hypothetical protein
MALAGVVASVSLLHGQAVNVISHTVISAQPPDPIHYEKAIGNFTSPSYPSYFLGTNLDGYVFDPQTGQNCSLGIPADYYERARPFTYPGDQYAGIIASLYTNVTWLENPLNGGLSLCNDWGTQVINPNRGAHELHVVDLDGDGKLDVLASGSEFPDDHPNSFISFQDSYNSWVLGTHPPPAGESIDVIAISGINDGARTNIVACNPHDNSLYWYQNPGGSAARTSKWKAHLIASASLAARGVSK